MSVVIVFLIILIFFDEIEPRALVHFYAEHISALAQIIHKNAFTLDVKRHKAAKI